MKFVVILFSLLVLSSCATIMNGGKKTLNFYSAENNTVITVTTKDGEKTNKGDLSVQVRHGLVTVVAKKGGCTTTYKNIEDHFSGGWYIVGNLFSWLYFGWIFDPMMGGMWYYDQKDFDVTPECDAKRQEQEELIEQLVAERKKSKMAKRKSKSEEDLALDEPASISEKPTSTTYVAVLETVAGADLLDYNSRIFLTDVLRDAASRSLPAKQGYVVMTRENINVMLPPGKSLEECEGSCLAETGRNIAADFVTQARIGKFASFMTITVELYESKTSKLISSITARASNEEQLLVEIEKNAADLFDKVKENR